jgi:hypothetical protein
MLIAKNRLKKEPKGCRVNKTVVYSILKQVSKASAL